MDVSTVSDEEGYVVCSLSAPFLLKRKMKQSVGSRNVLCEVGSLYQIGICVGTLVKSFGIEGLES
jgi:hypothetical protein